jgi:hypothetical protein
MGNGIKYVCGLLWRWDVVATGAVTIFLAGGVAAIYGDDFNVATVLFFIAIVWITAKAISWSEVKEHPDRVWISIVIAGLAIGSIAGSMFWIQHRESEFLAKHESPKEAPTKAPDVASLDKKEKPPVDVATDKSDRKSIETPRKKQRVSPPEPIASGPPVQAPPVTNYAPGGFATSGGYVDHPTINNGEKPPIVMDLKSVPADSTEVEVPKWDDKGHPFTSFEFYIETAWSDPKFLAICDRPCHAYDVRQSKPGVMISPTFRSGSYQDKPNWAIFVVDIRPFKTATYYLFTVQSDDGEAATIQRFSPLVAPIKPQ